jgi:hypothetical protein
MAHRVGRGIALLFLDLSARRGWVVSTTPRPLYPRERPGTHCTGGWMGLRTGLDVCENSRPPTGIRSPDRPASSQSLYRLSYPTHDPCMFTSYKILYCWHNGMDNIRITKYKFACYHLNPPRLEGIWWREGRAAGIPNLSVRC